MNTSGNSTHESFAVRCTLLVCLVLLLCCLMLPAGATNAQSVPAPATTNTSDTTDASNVNIEANKAKEANNAIDATGAGELIDQAAREIKAGMLATAPKIDGVMSAGEWKDATPFALSYQTFPGENIAPTERTEAMIGYDKEHLYLAFHAYDSDPAAIRARVARRDDLGGDDFITVWLDTYNDRRRAYLFRFNPLGIQADGIYTESDTQNLTWDGIIESKGRVTQDGYIIEVAIPFKTMRFQTGKAWGLQVIRNIARKDERAAWQPLSRARPGFLIQMGSLAELKGIFAGRTLDLTPTLTASANGEREFFSVPTSAGDPTRVARLNNVNRVEPGLTATYTLTPNLTLSGTVNPDFSQVEADVPQVNINQRFPLFFPERRQFFLEGNEVFRSFYSAAPNLIDTRQIVDPDYGIKLTGKIGRNTIGFLHAADAAPGLRVAGTDAAFGRNAQYNIFRYGRDIGRQTSVGAILTDRRFAGSSNTLVAVDGRIRFKEKHLFAFQISDSWTRDLPFVDTVTGATREGARRSGGALYFVYNFQGRKWDFGGSDSHVARDFRPGAGFIRRTGYDRDYAYVGYTFRPPKKTWWVSARPFVVGLLFRTTGGRLDDSFLDPGFDLKFARGVSIYTYHSNRRYFFAGRSFATQATVIDFEINSFKRFAAEGRLEFGSGVNFDPERAVRGRALDQRFLITFRPNNNLNTSLLYLGSRLSSFDRGGERLFNQDIIRSRTTYQLTRFNALRAILDYDTSRRQTGISVLYAYTPRPNTALYIGYNDLLFNGIDPLAGTRAQGLFRQRRTLFTKLSYNFRF